MASLSSSYRDRNYIIKDLILRLAEHGEMSQTALISCCRLNLNRHKFILYDLESNEFVTKNQIHDGKRVTTIFKPTWKGIEFSRTILEQVLRLVHILDISVFDQKATQGLLVDLQLR
jgi:predicted transcriptional regulator